MTTIAPRPRQGLRGEDDRKRRNTMFDTFIQLAGIFLAMFRIPVIAVLAFTGYYLAAVFFWYLVRRCRGDPVQRGSVRRIRQPYTAGSPTFSARRG